MQEFDGKEFVKRLKRATGEEKAYLLAKNIGVSESTLSKWNTGKGFPQINDLYAIYNQYHCSIDDLLGIDGSFEITPATFCRILVDLETHSQNTMTISADESEVTIKLKMPQNADRFAVWFRNRTSNNDEEKSDALETGKQIANITAIVEFLQNYAKLCAINLDDMKETVIDSLLGNVNDRASEVMKSLNINNADQKDPAGDDRKKKSTSTKAKRKEED